MTETPMERAQTYAALWLTLGDNWTYWLPVDASYRGGLVWLGGVKMRPHYLDGTPAWWELEEKGRVVVVRPAAEKRAS